MNESAIRDRAARAIAEKVFPGCVIGIEDTVKNIFSFGNFTYEPNSNLVHEDTVYDVASITKTIPIALTALTFIEKGLLGLNDRVIDYVPEITTENADKALIRHLLTYTYILKKNSNPNFSYENSQAKDILDFLYHREFEFLPGTHYQYSNAPANLLGIILERLSRERLYTLAKKSILDPLKMESSTFHPEDKKAIPPTEIISWRGEVEGIVHDETACILQREGLNAGCAGLFSNAEDLLNVADMLFHDGLFRGNKVFDTQTISLMTTNALNDIERWSGIGWELNQPKFMGAHAHEHMIGKTGFTGISYVIDPERRRAVVILSNRTYPRRPTNTDSINAFRRDIADIVFAG
jgi:CubicO group peptidase (beta-lactamase class C family)